MKARNQVLSFVLVVFILSGGPVLAREGRHGEVGGVFIRLVERQVGDREVVGMVVKPFDRDEPVVLLVPRENADMLAAMRRLREGQRLEAAFEREGDQVWATRLAAGRMERDGDVERLEGRERAERERAERRTDRDRPVEGERRDADVRREGREGDRPRERREGDRPMERGEGDRPREGREPVGENPLAMMAGHLREMSMQLREFAGHMRRMEMEIQELRRENERLRNILREKGLLEGERERVRAERVEREREQVMERERAAIARRERAEMAERREAERRADIERREMEERRNAERVEAAERRERERAEQRERE